jgi:uncharacterized protein involved in oxidation of intracellular sulfur
MAKAKSYVVVLNDGPYGNERSYNGLRTAMALAKLEGTSVKVFLMGDGVQCARAGQETPQGYYNVERMMSSLTRQGEVAT